MQISQTVDKNSQTNAKAEMNLKDAVAKITIKGVKITKTDTKTSNNRYNLLIASKS